MTTKQKKVDKYLTVPFHLEGFFKRLSDASIGAAFRAVYSKAYCERGDFDDLPLEIGCMAEQIWAEVQAGFDKAKEQSVTNKENAEKRWGKEKTEKATASDGMQSDATACDGMQSDATACETCESMRSDANHADKNRIDKNRVDTSIAQTEFALEGGSCSQKEEKTTCFSFEQFWEAYGQKKGRKDCEKRYSKISEAERMLIKHALPKYDAYLKATGLSQLYPLTFLNGEHWNDDFTIPQQPQVKTAESGDVKPFNPASFKQS